MCLNARRFLHSIPSDSIPVEMTDKVMTAKDKVSGFLFSLYALTCGYMKRVTSFMPNWRNLYRFMKDPLADWKPKAAIGLAILYLVWPIDLVPDLAPIIGWLDDIGITTFATAYLLYTANLYANEHPIKKIESGTDDRS